METLSKIRNLYKYKDGDQIEARMGVQIANGHSLTQHFDLNLGRVVNTDYTQHPPTLYPFPYSSKRGQYVVPATQGQQWYYNNPETETAGILDENGNVKSAFSDRFQKTTVTVGGVVYPALKIIKNLATANDLTDKYIFYKSTYNGKPFTCSQKIEVQTTVGSAKKLEIFMETQDGSGSNVLSNTNNWVKLTAALQNNGSTISTGVTYLWEKFVNGAWTTVTTTANTIEVISSSEIKVWNNGVDGEDLFRVTATHNGETQKKTQQLTDTADTFYIFDGCSQAGDAVEDGVDVTFTPVVYDRMKQIPDTTNTWYFMFNLINMITTATIGTARKNVTTFTVTSATLDAEKGVQVVISASNMQWT